MTESLDFFVEFKLRTEQLTAEAQKATAALEKVEKQATKTEKALADTTPKAEGRFKLLASGAGVLAAAFVTVAGAATAMAAQVSSAVREIAQEVPALAGRLGDVAAEVDRVSRATGRSQVEIAEGFREAARTGVTSLETISRLVSSASDLADATGGSLPASIATLDTALSGFNVSATRSREVAAELFTTIQGRTGIDQFASALQASIPFAQRFGVSLQDTSSALTTLLSRGNNPAQAAKEFRDLAKAGPEGAAGIRELADEARPAADSMKRLADATLEFRKSPIGVAAILRSEVSSELLRLGNEILPAVVAGLRGATDLIRTLRQRRGSGSFFDGLQLTIPDSAPQLASFIDRMVHDAQRARGELKGLESQIATLKQAQATTSGSFGQTSASEVADRLAAVERRAKLARDEIKQLDTAATIAAERLRDLGKPAPGNTGTGLGTVGEDAAKAAAATERASARVDAATRDMVERLAEIERGLFGGRPKSFWQTVADDLATYAETLKTATPEQAAFGAAIIQATREAAKLQDLLDKAGISLTTPAQVRTTPTGAIRQVDAEKEIGRIRSENARIEREASEAQAERDTERLDRLVEQGRRISDAVDGALDLANAFGIVDDEVRNILSSLSQVATGIGPLVEALQSGGTGGIIATALPVAGGVAQLAKSFAGLFDESPELQAAREALERNVEALKDNTRGLRDIDLTGSQIGVGRTGLARFLEESLPNLRGRSRISTTQVESALESFGLSLDDIRKLAQEARIDFVELSRETLGPFLEFLDQLGLKLEQQIQTGAFGDDFAGRLNEARTRFQFTPQVETGGRQVADLIIAALLGDDPSSLLADAFKDIDLNTLDDPEVQAQVRDIVRQLFETVVADGFDPSVLGDVNLDDFIGFLGEILGLIPEELERSGGEIDEAAVRFTEAVAKIGRATRVFDLSSLDQAELFLSTLSEFSPLLAELVAGFDLTTVAGIDAAIASLQGFFSAVEAGDVSLEGLGFTLDDLVAVIDLLQSASSDAADEVERLAREEQRSAEEARRAFDQAQRDEERRRAEAEREAERAHQEELRRIEEIRRARLEVGADTIRAVREQFQLFDVTDAAEQLRQLTGQLGSLAPVFRDLFAGLDATDAGSRAETLNRLKTFALQNPFGLESGSLSRDQVRSEVLTIAELIKQLNAVTITSDAPQNESFRVDRTITQIEGERISGLLATGNILLEAQLETLDRILSTLGGFSGLTPPGLPPASRSAGTTTIYLQVYLNGQDVTSSAPVSLTPTIRQLGQAIADDLLIAGIGG